MVLTHYASVRSVMMEFDSRRSWRSSGTRPAPVLVPRQCAKFAWVADREGFKVIVCLTHKMISNTRVLDEVYVPHATFFW